MKKVLVIMMMAIATDVMAQVFPYQNPQLSPEQRAEDLCNRLTLEEKAKLMIDQSSAITRLGVPQFPWWNETLHGVARNGYATVFPITMGMAASFDDALVYECFSAVSDEARVKYNMAKKSGTMMRYQGLSFWTPNINIFRDPRWGRGQETYGEDPYLTGKMGVAVVRGLQNPQNGYMKLLACAKHFAVHSGPEWNRHSFNIEDLPERDLWETYLPAFKDLVQKGQVAEVMCAYQSIDGQPCCSQTRYLQQILRQEWGFKGIVTSDCGAISDFYKEGHHEYTKTPEEAIGKAIPAGTDVNCGSVYKSIPEAVKQGLVKESEVDTSLKRLLVGRFKLGDMDPDNIVPWSNLSESLLCSKEHNDLAYKLAQQSMVLLKNQKDILPLNKDIKIAVLGPNANDSTMQWGNYNGFPRRTVTILEGLRSRAKNITYIPGAGYVDNVVPASNLGVEYTGKDSLRLTMESLLPQIKDADVVIFVGGISPRLEGEEMKVNAKGFKGGDRTDIELPEAQRQLLKAIHDTGKPLVYVNCSGSAIGLVPEQEQSCDAILQAWYPGERGGDAVADVIFGDYNPSGKLPITFYRSVNDLPDFLDYTMTGKSADGKSHGRTYRYFSGKPLYPFGYGLSYTTFQKSKITKKREIVDGRDGFTVGLDVKNIGKRDGKETVMVYVKDPKDMTGPIKTLRAFKKISLKAGEKQHITLRLEGDQLLWWDKSSNTMREQPDRLEIIVE